MGWILIVVLLWAHYRCSTIASQTKDQWRQATTWCRKGTIMSSSRNSASLLSGYQRQPRLERKAWKIKTLCARNTQNAPCIGSKIRLLDATNYVGRTCMPLIIVNSTPLHMRVSILGHLVWHTIFTLFMPRFREKRNRYSPIVASHLSIYALQLDDTSSLIRVWRYSWNFHHPAFYSAIQKATRITRWSAIISDCLFPLFHTIIIFHVFHYLALVWNNSLTAKFLNFFMHVLLA